jgi:hypothetical protein
MTCHSGGTLDIFLEPFALRPSLLVMGASPAALALAGLAGRAGFDVFAAAPGADADMFPGARQVLDGTDLSGLTCGTPGFVVVATQGKRDESSLEAALATGARYIAFIASERKAAKLRTYLKERGHDSLRVDAVVSPAGVEIGAVTPEEIALSVLAGLVKARREGGAVVASAPDTARAREDAQAGQLMSDQAPAEPTAADPVRTVTRKGAAVGMAGALLAGGLIGWLRYGLVVVGLTMLALAGPSWKVCRDIRDWNFVRIVANVADKSTWDTRVIHVVRKSACNSTLADSGWSLARMRAAPSVGGKPSQPATSR